MAKRPPRPDRLEQFKATYFAECQERQADIDRVLQAIREQGGDRERFDELFRAVHSIKGGGGAFGFEDIVSLAHSFETVLDALRQGTLELDEGVSEALVVAADALARAMSGSTMSPQSLGTGFSTLTGSVCCSGTQIESNPSPSARFARMAMSVERCVGMKEIPRRIIVRMIVHRRNRNGNLAGCEYVGITSLG